MVVELLKVSNFGGVSVCACAAIYCYAFMTDTYDNACVI